MVVVQLLRHIQLFGTPRTAACQASGFFTISWSLLNSCSLSWWCHTTILSSVTPFSCPQPFPASGSFPISRLFASAGQSIRASASASVFPMNTQIWFPLGLTGLISLLSKGLSRVFSSTIIKKNQFFSAQTLTSIPDYWKKHSIDYMDFYQQMMSLLFNMLCWS